MSRVAKNPVTVPAGVEVKFGTDALVIKGKNGELSFPLHSDVAIELNDGKLTLLQKMTVNRLMLCLVLLVHWLITWLRVFLKVLRKNFN